MQYRPDIVISDRLGAVVAVVEVKALDNAGTHIATRYLRNLLVHGLAPHTGYVLLITSDRGYLWRNPEDISHESPPMLTFPMERITRHYLPSNGESAPVRDLVLETIVKQWLSDLADGIVIDDEVTSALRESGFLRAVRNGLINAAAPA